MKKFLAGLIARVALCGVVYVGNNWDDLWHDVLLSRADYRTCNQCGKVKAGTEFDDPAEPNKVWFICKECRKHSP